MTDTTTRRAQSWERTWRSARANVEASFKDAALIEMIDRDYRALVAWGERNPVRKEIAR